jgi:putative ABC transport system ATP-binding protein
MSKPITSYAFFSCHISRAVICSSNRAFKTRPYGAIGPHITWACTCKSSVGACQEQSSSRTACAPRLWNSRLRATYAHFLARRAYRPADSIYYGGMMDVCENDAHALVRLQGVSKVYRMGEIDVHALRSVDLEIRRGEMVAIMGASGSGKSTMLHILGTLDRPSEGHYFLDGEPVDNLDEYELSALRNRKMGFVFQQFNLLPRDTARQNVELPMVYAGERPPVRRQRALLALDRVGLSDRVDHLPNQLSGGQQQRVSIARALVNDPLLLLADEPTGALDSATTKQVMELFVELHHEGMTVVIVTHDASIASYAERVVRFEDGVLLSDETRGPNANDLVGRVAERGRVHG